MAPVGRGQGFPDATRQELPLKGKHAPVVAYWIPP